LSVSRHQWPTPIFISIFINWYLQTKLRSVWCLRFSQSRVFWALDAASLGEWFPRFWRIEVPWSSGSSSLLGLGTIGTLTASSWLVATFSACIYKNASLRTSGHAVVAVCSSQRNATTATSLRIRYVFEHARSKRTALDCRTSVYCENRTQIPDRDLPWTESDRTLSWAWPYLELSMNVPWAERERTLNGMWSYLELSVAVPSAEHDRTLSWAWSYFELSVTVPWAERDRTLNGVWSYLELNVAVPWAEHDRTLSWARSYFELSVTVPWAEHDRTWAKRDRTLS